MNPEEANTPVQPVDGQPVAPTAPVEGEEKVAPTEEAAA